MPVVALDAQPSIVAIIPTMGETPVRLQACVESLVAGAGVNRLAVLVVLNSSTVDPATLGLVEGAVEVVVAGLNLGWAGGLVFGASLSDADTVWFIQDDMTVHPDTLDHLVRALDADSRLAVVSPLVVDADGLVPIGSCGGVVSNTGRVGPWLPSSPQLPRDLQSLDSLGYVPSRGMLVRRSALQEMGGPNPRLFPLTFVDVDFCEQATAKGYTFRLVRTAVISHGGNAATPSGLGAFLFERNEETFAHDWYGQAYEPRPSAGRSERPDPVSAVRHPVHPAVGARLVEAVAQSATDAFIHLARHTSAERSVIESQLAGTREKLEHADSALERTRNELAAVLHSRSWRVTAPLRAAREWVDALRRG